MNNRLNVEECDFSYMVRQNEDDPIYFVLSWQVDAVSLAYGILYHMFHVS